MDEFPVSDNGLSPAPRTPGERTDDVLGERVDALAAWIHEIDAQVRATTAAGDAETLKQLARALDAFAKHDPKIEERLTNRVDVLADRFSTLAGTVNATAAALAGKDGELAALRRELDQGLARSRAVVPDLRDSVSPAEVAELRKEVASLSSERQARTGRGGSEGMSDKTQALTERVDSLAKTVATTAAGLTRREGEFASLRRSLDESNARVEQVAAAARGRVGGAKDERFESLAATVAGMSARLVEREQELSELRTRLEESPPGVDSAVTELRQSLEALAARVAEADEHADELTAAGAFEERLEAVDETVSALAERLNTMATTVELGSRALADKELELAAIHRNFEEASSRADAAARELRELLALRAEHGSVEVDGRLEALAAQVEALTEGLADVDALLSAPPAVDGSAATAKLERALHEVAERLSGVERSQDVSDARLARSSEAWAEETARARAQLESLAATVHEVRAVPMEVDVKLEELGARIVAVAKQTGLESARAELANVSAVWSGERDELRGRLDVLANALAERDSGSEDDAMRQLLSSLEVRLGAIELARHEVATDHQKLQTRFEALSNALAERPEPMSADLLASLKERVDAVELAREEAETGHQRLETRLEALSDSLAERPEPIHPDRIASLDVRLDAVERTRDDAATDYQKLQARLEALSSVIAERPEPMSADLLASLKERVDAVELSREEAENGHQRLETRLEALSNALADRPEPMTADLIASLKERVDAVELAREEATTEIGRAANTWASDSASLETRIDGLAKTIDDVARAQKAPPVQSEEMAQVRALVDALWMRLAATEKELAALSGSRDVGAQLNELASRLASVESSREPEMQTALEPGAGEGRFRMELRGLEQRMHHAESATRENREAVLTQLERLAARIEWRLQQLETGGIDAMYEPEPVEGPLGQVVPIRGEA